jgi:hypothetical protein
VDLPAGRQIADCGKHMPEQYHVAQGAGMDGQDGRVVFSHARIDAVTALAD